MFVKFKVIELLRPGSKKFLFTVLMTCEAAGGEGKKIKMKKNKNSHPSVK